MRFPCLISSLVAGLLLQNPWTANAFAPLTSFDSLTASHGSTHHTHTRTHQRMVVLHESPVKVTGQNLELTDALLEHVQRRIQNPLDKLGATATQTEVVLSVSKNPKVKDAHRVEVCVQLKGSTTIVCKNESPDMYTSIDQASHALYRKLAKYKDRRLEGHHGGNDMAQDITDALEGWELAQDADLSETTSNNDWEWQDPEKPEIVKVNSFDLEHAISVEEAVFALDCK